MVPPADKLTDNGLIGQLVANDTKVIARYFGPFCFSSSGLIGRRYEYERTRISGSALFIGIGVVNEQRTDRTEEL